MLYEIVVRIPVIAAMISVAYTSYCLFRMTVEREREREKSLKGLITSMFPLNLLPQFHGPVSKRYYNRFVLSAPITAILFIIIFLFYE